MTFDNLYTSGGEFKLPNGEIYVGPYHVHVSKGAMVGGTHSRTAHDPLVPVNSSVAERVRSLQAQLRGEMSATTKRRQASRPSAPAPQATPSAPSAPSSGSSGGGGGGGY